MERLSSAQGLVVSQKKEWGEILTGFEAKINMPFWILWAMNYTMLLKKAVQPLPAGF